MNDFITIGYFEDYYQNGKFMGNIICDEQPDRKYGYKGRKMKCLSEPLILNNGKKLKPGIYRTSYNRLCGRYNGSQEEKISAIMAHKIKQNMNVK